MKDFCDIVENYTKEDNNLRSEFCTVDKIGKEVFTLKNTNNETYYIDIALVENFKEGDLVVLIYRSRTSLSKGGYIADVYAIYPDNNALGDDDGR